MNWAKLEKERRYRERANFSPLFLWAFGDFDFISIDFDVFRHYASGCDQVEMFRAPN
jgi:hypothetical protein